MIRRTFFAALLALLLPCSAAALPAEVVARFIDVLRRDDLGALAAFAQTADPEDVRDLRDLLGYFDCVSVQHFEWTPVRETGDRIAMRVDVYGTAELKGATRPVKPLPKTWHIEARRVKSEWTIVSAITEERRVVRAMIAAPDDDAVERELRLATSVDPRDVLKIYGWALEAKDIAREAARWEHAIDLARRVGDIATEVEIRRRLLHWYARAHPPRGLEVAAELESFVRTHGSRDDLAGTLLTAGVAYVYAGDNDRALEKYVECAAMAEELDDPTRAIKCAQMIVAVQSPRDRQAALRAVDRIGELSQRTQWEEGLMLVLQDRATIHLDLGNLDLARAANHELIRLGGIQGHRSTVAYAMSDLAEIARSEERYQEAVEWFRKAKLRTEGYAVALREIGELDEAESVMRELEGKSEPPMHCAWYAVEASRLHLQRGNVRAAIDAANEALDRLAAVQGTGVDAAVGLTEPIVVMGALANRARAFRKAGYRREAEIDMRSVVALVEDRRESLGGDALTRARASRDQLATHIELVDLLVDERRTTEALQIAELMKARGLRHAIGGGRIDVSASMSSGERTREATLEQDVVTLNRTLLRTRTVRAAQGVEDRLEVARRELEAFRSEMRLKYPEVARRRADEGATLTLPANAKSLAAIEYVVAEEQVIAFVITRGTNGSTAVHAERLPISKRALARDAREVAELAAARSPSYRNAAARLHASLLAPVERHLRGVTTVAIIPDGVLWTVPFHALVTPDGASVIDRRAVYYAHSLALLSGTPEKKPARSHLLALGNPTIGEGRRAKLRSVTPGVTLGPLIEAEEEVRSLASMYPTRATRLYFRDQARETVFKSEAPECGIIHIAAHAIVDDRAPMYSAIVLAPSGHDSDDGLLEAREVVDLPLNAELAVLSACETARGQVNAGEGMIGLPWAFFVAGCPTTIVSQWKAESASTAALMVELHTRLRAGATVAEALRAAQLAVRKRREYSHPFYWAPFVAIGAAEQALSVSR